VVATYRGWIIVVARSHHVHGHLQNVDQLLREANRKTLTQR